MPSIAFSVSDPARGGNITSIYEYDGDVFTLNMRGDIGRVDGMSVSDLITHYAKLGCDWSEQHNAWPSIQQRMAR